MVLASHEASSQDIPLPLDARPQLQLNFDRQNNFTYSTRFRLNHTQQGPKYEWELRLNHEQLFNTSRPSDRFVQLQVNAQWWQFYRLKGPLSIASWIEVDQFWNSRNQRYSAYLGFRYQPWDFLSITPLLGYSWDYRQQILDQGLSPAIRVESTHNFGDGLQTRTYLLARIKYINPRRQQNLQFRSDWSKVFGQNAAINFQLRAGSNQMDDYLAGSIERIKADTLGASLSFQYPLLPWVIWQSDNQVFNSQRRFVYDPFRQETEEFNDLSFDQFEFRTWQRFSFQRSKWDGYFNYEFQSLGRAYELQNSLEAPEPTFIRQLERERQKDFFRELTNLDLLLNYRPNGRDRITLSANNRYLQYDTPSEENFDDHDELSYGAGLEWQANWSPSLMTRYKLVASRRQYAFLFTERSQDNYTQRNLRLEVGFRWDLSSKLRINGQQYLYVTYNVKDFSDLNLTDRSTRNLESRLNLRYLPHPNWRADFNLYRKQTHLSYLNWNAFSETPLDTLTIYLLEEKTFLQLGRGSQVRLRLEGGYRHFSQLRYLNTSMVSLKNLLTPINLRIRTHQTGPTTGFTVFARGGNSISASVWWQIQDQSFRFFEIDQLTNLNAGYREENLLLRDLHLRPFFQLKLDWNLWVSR